MSPAESPSLSDSEMFQKILEVRTNRLFQNRLREAESFGVTVSSKLVIYASLKPHADVKRQHRLKWDDVLFEGRMLRRKDSVQLFSHSASYPAWFFPKGEAEYNAFRRAIAASLQNSIDPESEIPWVSVT